MKRFIFTCILPVYSIAMENPDHPRYHINNKVIYLRETKESGDALHPSDFTNVPVSEPKENPVETQWKNANVKSISRRSSFIEIATINNGISNKTKIVIAALSCGGSIIVAVISAVVTYYVAKKC